MTLGLTLLVLGLGGQAEPTPAEIVSKMLAYYHDAKTMVGTITMNQRAGGKQATIQTELQFENPSKFYLRQVLQATYGGDEWLVTSDGSLFSYNVPDNVVGRRLIEPCSQNGVTFGVREIYQAAVRSIADRSTPLDIIIGRKEDLQYRNFQWKTVELLGRTKVGDVDVRVIGGQWREYGKAPVSAAYQMFIDDQSRLLRFVERTTIGTKATGQTFVQDVETVWDVNVTKNGPVKPELFKVVR